MAKRANYGFEKRQKELERQKKRDRKAEKKRMKKESAVGGDQREYRTGGGGHPGSLADSPSDAHLKSDGG